MATKKQKASNGDSPGSAVDATGPTTATAGTKKPRKPVNPEDMFYWTEEQDLQLTLMVLAHPGQYTPKRLIEALSANPLFAGEAQKLTPEKVRQHVNKLSSAGVERGAPELKLKRSANASGHDLGDVVVAAARQLGLGLAHQAQAPVSSVPATAPQTQAQAPAPAPAPFVPPTGGFSSGGLIPTTG